MKRQYAPHQQPKLSDNQQLIRPVSRFVCPPAVEMLRQIRHRALPVLRGLEDLAVREGDAIEPCYLFDFLPGTSLNRLTAEELAGWRRDARVAYLAELAEIVDFLHHQGETGLMHLDIKPANLLLDPDQRPALIDFETLQIVQPAVTGNRNLPHPDDQPATRIDKCHTVSANSEPAAILGITCTPGYAAPEVLLGHPVPASDLYALGLCLLWLLSDYDPDTSDPLNLPAAVASLPPALATCAARCLMTDPDCRYPDGAALADALRNSLAPGPMTAAEPAAVAAEELAKEPAEEPAAGPAEKPAAPDPTLVGQPAEPVQPTFSRLFSVWDGAEFGCELAVQLREYYRRVLVIDGDLICPQADLLLGKKSRPNSLLAPPGTDNLNQVLAEAQRGTLTPGRLRELAWPSLTADVDLFVFGDNLDDYEHIPPGSFLQLLEIARQSYPAVVILLNRFIYDAFTCLGLMNADQVLVPASGSVASFRSFNRSIEFLALRRQIDPARVRFVAFPYDERTDLSLGTLNTLAENRLIGSVQIDLARQRRRGSAKPYAVSVSAANAKEYNGIIARLNHQSRKESPDADRHLARPIRRTIRILSQQAPSPG